jgi:hypothetical protein
MYFLIVILLMLVLPAGSILLDRLVFKSSTTMLFLIGKWFVFWSVGARLFLAGLRQAIRPRFTSKTIFVITSKEPLHIVQELGFANISMGALGIVSILSTRWIMPAAIAGCLFYGLAGVRHIVQSHRNKFQNAAMVSDLFVFAVLLVSVIDQFMLPLA